MHFWGTTFRTSLKMHAKGPLDAKKHPNWAKIDRKSIKNHGKINCGIRYGMLEISGGLCQKSCMNSEDALGNPIRRASHLRVRRSRASVLNSPYPAGVLACQTKADSVPGSRRACLSLPLRRTRGDRRAEPAGRILASFFDFFRFFRCLKKRSKNGRSKNRLFPEMLAILVSPALIFSHFWAQNRSPEATFSVFF